MWGSSGECLSKPERPTGGFLVGCPEFLLVALPLVVVGWVGCLVFLDCCWLDWLYGFPWLLLVGLVAWFSVTVMAGLVVYIRLSFARLVGRFS